MNLNGVQIITYADSLGGDLSKLKFVLDKYLKGKVNGVHVLPFYPSSGDRGFSPLTHLEVDPKFGTWDDIKKIGDEYDLVADVVFNHVSRESEYFQHYLKHGDLSKYKDLFLKVEDVFGDDERPEFFKKIFRPRPTSVVNEIEFGDSVKKRLWSTFTDNQMDVNWNSELCKKIYGKYLEKLCKHGVKLIRADAMGYACKKKDTDCFFIDDTYDLLGWVENSVADYGCEVLPEVHGDSKMQLELAKKCHCVYDFQLPIIALYSLYFGDNEYLTKWIRERSDNMITTLDAHDGLGVVDVGDLMSEEDIKKTVDKIYGFGGNLSMRASGGNSDNVDVYQINCTYYSATGENDDMYLCARLIQLFLPGVPQIYYAGLLAGVNDGVSLEKSNNGRDVLRHNYTLSEIERDMERPVVRELLRFMELRNNNNAFGGKFELLESGKGEVVMKWENGDCVAKLEIDLRGFGYKISCYDGVEWVVVGSNFS